MKQQLLSIWSRLRNSDYTGNERRPGLTGVNVGLAVGITVTTATISRPAAVIASVGTAVMILVRGYAIPGTASLLERAETVTVVSRLFRESTHRRSPRLCESLERVTPGRSRRGLPAGEAEQILFQAGVIDSQGDGNYTIETAAASPTTTRGRTERDYTGVHLTDTFSAEWLARLQRVRDGESQPSDEFTSISMFDVDPSQAKIADYSDDGVVVTEEGDIIGWWDSAAAFSADITIDLTLAAWVSVWGELTDQERADLISIVRLLLNSCPACGRVMDESNSLIDTDRSGGARVSITCNQCGSNHFPDKHR